MSYGILPDLTKDYILKHITQEQIFEYYLCIPVKFNEIFCSPPILRKDSNPTCSFKYNSNNKLRLRDWSGFFWGDCFDAVGKIIGVNPNDRIGFGVILDRIARDFRLHKYSHIDTYETGSTHSINEAVIKHHTPRSKHIFNVKVREWNKHDANYWRKGDIGSVDLKEGDVYPVWYLYKNSELIYTYEIKDPCYCYFLGKDENGINNFKFYFPYRKKFRFLSNNGVVQGLNKITCGEICLIIKSYKDAIAIKKACNGVLDLQAVSPSAEGIPITKKEYEILKQNFRHIFSLYDFDRTGVSMANKLRKLYAIEPLFILKDRRLLMPRHIPLYGVKDFFELVDKYKTENVKDIIEKTTEKFQERFDIISKLDYEISKYIQNVCK